MEGGKGVFAFEAGVRVQSGWRGGQDTLQTPGWARRNLQLGDDYAMTLQEI